MSRVLQSGLRALLLAPLGVAVACNGGGTSEPLPPVGTHEFVSHVPGNSRAGNDSSSDGGLGAENGTGGSSSAPPTDDDGGESPERLISEADIIKVDGTKLYALSRYSGLSVIDVADPAHLVLLGGHKTSAIPFEMYVEGERAYVMYNGWGRYEVSEDGYYSWQTTSRVQALDLSDPAKITVIGQHDVGGEISDSRKVGDVLYLVTFENGYCYSCDEAMNTRITSFDVSNPDTFQLIDELRLVDEQGYWGQRSIAVTTERIYVSGMDWSGKEQGVIDVIDISDPSGDLVRGAEVAIAGPIENRWQMDEFEGTLRVISQPGGWNTEEPPVVETFRVESSSKLERLASLNVVLPRPEDLRSVRFDGDRAYAITFERTDPLFTFDLSDPAAPTQVGELEIPGWVYHMEPRGDRIYALGFDQGGDTGGALHVSLFDVSDLAQPTQLARVNFGGDWASFAEDQDRIHKAFNILQDEGLILVPFSGWDYDESDTECYSGQYLSGIQLVDMTTDTLTLRGVAPQVGQARRGFLVGETLMGVSDNAVQTFDISDRDEPTALGRLELARNVTQIRAMGATMLRFGSDWWTEETVLDFAALDQVDQAEPLGDIDLSAYEVDADQCNGYAYWENQVLVEGGYAYVPRRSYSYDTQDKGSAREKMTFFVVDIRDRADPKLAGTFEVSTNSEEEYLSGIIKTDSALLVGHVTVTYSNAPDGDYTPKVTLTYDVLSLADPAAPEVVSTLEMPESISSGGFGRSFYGCAIDVGWGWWGGGYYYGDYYGDGRQQALVSGDIVASQHQVPLDDGTGRVRYYLDRIDVSDPEQPVLLPSVNIPGGVVDFNHESGRIVTVDYVFEEKAAASWDECQNGYFDYDSKRCKLYRRTAHTLELEDDVATLLDSGLIDHGNNWASGVAVTSSRVFATYQSYDDQSRISSRLRTFTLAADGELSDAGEVETDGVSWGSLVARGQRAFISSYGQLVVVDSSNPAEPEVKTHELGGYSCNALEVVDDTAYCALGYQGVQAFPLD